MEGLSRKMENAIPYKRRTHGPFKVSMCVYQKYGKTFEAKTIITDSSKVSSGHMHLFHYESVAQLIRDLIDGHKRNYQKGLKKQEGRSTMNLEEIESTRLDFLEMNPAGMRRHLQTPKFIKNKKATINPLNNDNECFKCALKIAIHKNELSKSALSKYMLQPLLGYDFS